MASIAVEAVLEGVRGYLEELLRPVTPEDLYRAIQEDVDPWDFAPSRVRRRGSRWAREMRKYQDRVTPQLVLSWLQADRPDLHNLIINIGPKGTKWLARRTENIKEQLWSSDARPQRVPIPHEEEEEILEEPEEIEEPPAKIRWG